MSRERHQLSAQPARVLLEWVAQRDLPEAEWILDLPIRSEELRSPRRQISWELFLTLCTRLREIAGASLPAIVIGREIGERLFTSSAWRALATGSTPEELYMLRADEVVGAFFSGLSLEAAVEDSGFQLTLEVPERSGDAGAFFELTTGILEQAPRCVGRPPALVSVKSSRRRAIYSISLPHAATEPPPKRGLQRSATTSSEESLRALLDASPDVLCEVAPDGSLNYVSPVIQDVLGFAPEHFLGRSFVEFLHADELPEHLENYAKFLLDPAPRRMTFRAPHADGSRRWLEASVKPFVDSNHQTRIACILRDVSEQKLGSERLYEREQQYRALVENSVDGVALCDAAGALQRTSPLLDRWLRESGTDTIVGLVHPEDRERWTQAWRVATRDHAAGAIDLRIVVGSSEPRWFELRWSPLRDSSGEQLYTLNLRDVTRHRQDEDTLQAIAEGLSSDEPAIFPTLTEHLAAAVHADAVFIAVREADDGARTLAVWSDGTLSDDFHYRLMGTPCEKTLSREICCYPRGVQQLFPRDEELRERGIEGYIGMPLMARDGEVLGLVACLFRNPIADAERASVLVRLFANRACVELERMRELEALDESRARFALLAETPHELISEIREDGRIVYFSPNIREILGYDPKQFVGSEFLSLVHADDRPRALRAFRSAIEEGRRGFATHRFRHADGHYRWLDTTGGAYSSTTGRQQVIFFSRDVTERMLTREALQRSEEELRQAQKMEAIGRLAGGVAHDFNNLLTAIIGYGDLLLEQVGDDSARHDAQEILNAARRAEGLTRQLLAFSRRQVLQPTVLDVNAMLKSLERTLRSVLGKDIEIATRLDRGLWRVRADPSQLEQVILNLAANAREALPRGGRVEIETSNRKIADHEVESDVPPGDYVRIRVSDDGAGMHPATLARIFEPFFTTKARDQGSGLGLSMAYGIIRQSGGHIRVESEVGAGSQFDVYLPRTAPEARAERQRAQLAAFRGDETILVVEDSDPVRQLVERYLRRLGYEVLSASKWSEARSFCEDFPRPIHLLLTDVILPEVDGITIALRARALRPELRVIYMSGFSGELIESSDQRDDDLVLLEKPFTPSTLLRTVRERLDTPPPARSVK